jgi:hypothetical protein
VTALGPQVLRGPTEAAAFHDPNGPLLETINDLMAWRGLYARYRALTSTDPTDR